MAEQRTPTMYMVPAGTEAARCRSGLCQAVIYFVDSLRTPGKKVPVDCSCIGGRAPSPLEDGAGILHPILCKDAERFREKRPPARHRVQREIDVDHKPPHCLICGCSQQHPCELTAAEAGVAGEPFDVPREKYACTWVQTDPYICSRPSCVEQRKELPLRMRVAKGGQR